MKSNLTIDDHGKIRAGVHQGNHGVSIVAPATSGRFVVIDPDGSKVGYVDVGLHQARATAKPSGDIKVQPSQQLLPPGTWSAMAIQVATFGYIRPCSGCKSRARAMDAAGWQGLPRLWLRYCWSKL